MAFALSVVKLEEAVVLPGCPICRLKADAAQKSARTFLFENTLDPGLRTQIMESHGFCPEHTLLLAAVEMSTDGPTLGINSIYEQLTRVTAAELRKLAPPRQAWLRKLHHPAALSGIHCPLCEVGAQTERNMLEILFEEMESDESKLFTGYAQSDGVCYSHLLLGIELNAKRRPAAARLLLEDAALRLENQSAGMKEYSRKHDWHYRDETLSAEENAAWLKVLTFFSGLPAQRFTHKIDLF